MIFNIYISSITSIVYVLTGFKDFHDRFKVDSIVYSFRLFLQSTHWFRQIYDESKYLGSRYINELGLNLFDSFT